MFSEKILKQQTCAVDTKNTPTAIYIIKMLWFVRALNPVSVSPAVWPTLSTMPPHKIMNNGRVMPNRPAEMSAVKNMHMSPRVEYLVSKTHMLVFSPLENSDSLPVTEGSYDCTFFSTTECKAWASSGLPVGETDAVFTISKSAYKSAIALYQGVYLPNRIFEDWSSEEREKIQILILGAYVILAEIVLNENPLESIRLAQCAIAIDKTWEDAYRLQMQAYIIKGNRPQAIKAYQKCADVLEEEYGIDPLPATKKVLQKAAENRIKKDNPVEYLKQRHGSLEQASSALGLPQAQSWQQLIPYVK